MATMQELETAFLNAHNAGDTAAAQVLADAIRQAGYTPQPQEQKQSSVLSELGRGAKQFLSSARTGIGSLVSPEESAIAGVERAKKIDEEAGQGASWEAVKNKYDKEGLLSATGEALSQIPRAVAQQVPQMGATIAAARTGAGIGSLIEPGLGTIAGGIVGAGSVLLPQFMGSNVERQAQEQQEAGQKVDINRTKAYTAAAAQAALEGAGTAITLGKTAVKGILGITTDAALASSKARQELIDVASQSIKKAAGMGAVHGLAEIPVELGQQILERAQAGLDLTSPDALKEYGETLYQTALVGPTIGAGAGVHGRSSAKTQLAEAAPPAVAPQGTPEQAAQAERIRRQQLEQEQQSAERMRGARQGEQMLAKEEAERAKAEAAQRAELEKQAAAEMQALRDKREAELRETFPADYSDLIQRTNAYAELSKELASLNNEKNTSEINQRRQAIQQQLTKLSIEDQRVPAEMNRIRAENAKVVNQLPDELKAKYAAEAFTVPTPQQMEMREATVDQPAGTVQKDLFGNPIQRETPVAAPAETEKAESKFDIHGVELPPAPEGRQSPERAQLMEQYDTLAREMGRLKAQYHVAPTEEMRLDLLKRGEQYQASLKELRGKVKELDAQQGKPTINEKQLALAFPKTKEGEAPQRTLEEQQPVTEPKIFKPTQLTPETVPTKMSPEVLGALGIGPTSVMRKPDHGIHQLDIAKPEEAAQVKTLLEAYKEGKSEGIVKKVDAYLARPEFKGVTNGQVPQAAAGKANVRGTKPSVRVSGERSEVPAGQPKPSETGALGRAVAAVGQLARGKGKPAPAVEGKAPKIKLPEALKEKPATNAFGTPIKPANKETSGLEARVESEIEPHVKAGDTRKALQAIVNSSNPNHTELHKAIAKRLLSSEKLPAIEVVTKGSLGTENGRDIAGQYDPKTDTVKLDADYVNSETMLHEVVHGFVHTLIEAHLRGDINNPGVRKLQELFNELKANHPELANKYGMTSLSEFASEAMSNHDFQEALRNIPSRRESNVFTEFVKKVLQILGLSPNERLTALASAIIHTDSILKEGRKLQEAATGKEGQIVFNKTRIESEFGDETVAAIEAIHNQHPELHGAVTSLVNNGLQGTTEARKKGPIAELFRRQALVDRFATVEAKVSQLFSKGVRDAFGNVNPMVLARQAVDNAKFTTDFFNSGGIRLSKDGIFETYKNDASMAKAMVQTNELAKKEGVTYNAMKEQASTILEGHRLYTIREEHNAVLEKSAQILEGQGKFKEADAERKKIIKLHMLDKEIDAMEKAFQNSPSIKEILNTLNKTRYSAIDLMIATGRITKEQGQFWKDNASYVPFDRVFDEESGPVRFARGKGLAIIRDIPGMKGSLGRPINNVFDAYAKRLGWMIETTMSNYASVQVLETMTLADFATKHARPEQATNKNLVVPRLFKDGKPVFYEVQNEYDMLAFQQAPEIMSGLVKALASISRVLRVAVTALPPFAVNQVIQDAQRAAILSGNKRPFVVAAKTLYNFPVIFYGEVTGKKTALVRALEKSGIVGDFDGNIYEPASDVEKALGVKKRGMVGSIYHTLEQFTKASDIAARAAVYEETMKDTGDQVLAQSRARELINFNRKGSAASIRTASRVITFFNAYAQGLDLVYRAASGRESVAGINRSQARKMFYSRMALMTAWGFVFALSKTGDSDDDKWYQETDESVRDNNWVISKGFKIPLPKEFGFVFKAIPERIVSYMHRNGTDEEQSILSMLGGIAATAFSAYGSPTAVPSAIRPILENMTNYSFFMQRELESASQKKLEPGYRTASGTSEFAKTLGRLSAELPVPDEFGTALQLSPIKIDNLLKGLLGTTAMDLLMFSDAVLNPDRPDRPIHTLPFASTFMYDQIGSDKKSEFYNLRERVGEAKTTFDTLKASDPQAAANFAEKNAKLLSIEPTIASTLKQLSELRRIRNLVENGTPEMLGISSAERREYIDEIKKSENETVAYIRTLKKELEL